MPSQGGFSVTWEQYGSVMCAGFQELQQRAEFVDMTIAADGHLVRVHQMVVGLASPFLKELLRSAPSPNPVLFLNNVSHKMLCCILEYMYTGEALVLADDLKTFIATAKALRVRGLEDMMVPEPADDASSEKQEVVVTQTYASSKTSSASTVSHSQKINIGKNVDQSLSCNNVDFDINEGMRKRPADTLTSPAIKSTKKPHIMRMSSVAEVPAKVHKLSLEESSHRSTISHKKSQFDVIAEVEAHSQDEFPEDLQCENSDIDDTGKGESTIPKKPDIMFTISNMGRLQMILNRYLYREGKPYKDGRRRWECVNAKSNKCNAYATTMDNELMSRLGMHNHPYHDRKIIDKVKKNLVFSSITNTESEIMTASTTDAE